jgi:hypothetical protein
MCLIYSAAQAQTLTTLSPISFGQMIVAGSGDVTIPTTSDTRSSTGAIALVGFALVQRASISITYTPGAQVVISFPASMPMTGANSPTLEPTLDGPSVRTVPVSGTLTVFLGGKITFTSFGATGVATAVVPVTVDPL